LNLSFDSTRQLRLCPHLHRSGHSLRLKQKGLLLCNLQEAERIRWATNTQNTFVFLDCSQGWELKQGGKFLQAHVFWGLFFERVFIRLLEPKRAMRTPGLGKEKGIFCLQKINTTFLNPFHQERKGFVLHFKRENGEENFFKRGGRGEVKHF